MENDRITDEMFKTLTETEKYYNVLAIAMRAKGWHHEDELDKCRHFHFAEPHKGKYTCCYNGCPVCEIRGHVCAMLIPREN